MGGLGIIDILLLILIAAAVAAALRRQSRNRKNGGCSCGCAGCAAKDCPSKDIFRIGTEEQDGNS